jgi:hypothetical protein
VVIGERLKALREQKNQFAPPLAKYLFWEYKIESAYPNVPKTLSDCAPQVTDSVQSRDGLRGVPKSDVFGSTAKTTVRLRRLP